MHEARGGMYRYGWAVGSQLPSFPALYSHSLDNSWPQLWEGPWWVDSMLSLLLSPRASSKFKIIGSPSFSFITNFLLIILWVFCPICGLLLTQTVAHNCKGFGAGKHCNSYKRNLRKHILNILVHYHLAFKFLMRNLLYYI